MSSYDDASRQGGATGLYPWFWGAYWLGPIIIPPLPMYFGMTDRVTAAVYYLTFSADATHLIFSQTPPAHKPTKIWPPWDGPFVGQFNLRMGISNDHLSIDPFPEQGAGPFATTPSNIQQVAGIFATIVKPGGPIDHLMFQVGSVRFSIFGVPHTTYFDEFLASSDVIQ
jgi:hypothetical protein